MAPVSPRASCPPEAVFAAFASGDLPPEAQGRLEEHVDECAPCRELLALLARDAPPVPGPLGLAVTVFHGSARAAPWASPQPAQPMPLAAGDIVAGRFEIEARVNAGGMGAIYRARDRHTAETVAIKVLEHCRDGSLERFEREALILAELRHAGIVRYVAHGALLKASETGAPRPSWREEGGFFLAMEWMEGEDLAHRLKRGPLGPSDAIVVAERVAAALAVAHDRGIVHRDLKPSNIFLRSGKLEELALLDFGVARLVEPDFSLTTSGLLIGTLAYMAPEQATGKDTVDARADVFALGCLIFECVTGQRPFQAHQLQALLAKIVVEEPPRLRALEPRTPEALDALVARMLAKAPEERPVDAGKVVLALTQSGLSQHPPPAQPGREQLALGKGELRVYSVVMAIVGKDSPTVALGGRGRAALAAHGGRVEGLSDGSLLVTLGGTGAPTDQAAGAARTALALRELLSPGAPIALATGRGDAIALYPLGEALDRATELLRVPPPEGTPGELLPIRIDEVTRSLLDLRFDVGEDARSNLLRGQRNDETIRTLLGRPTPCVGRDAELALLETLVAQSAEEPVARAAVVTGPAGIGKSRLRYELLRRVRAPHPSGTTPQVWIARGDPMRAGSTFGLVAEAVRATAGLYAGEPLEISQRKLAARLARHVAPEDVGRLTEFLGELVGARFVDDERPQLRAARVNATLMGDQIRRAWLDFVQAECAKGPLVIVLEDLHWGDLATVELIDTTLGLLSERPLAVVAMGRPETYDLFPDLWARRSPQALRLGGLSRSASERLAREVLDPSVAPETVRGIVDLAAGNAFYLEELLRAVVEGRGDALPPNVVAMAQARLEALDVDLRRLLRAASVFGRTFWWGGVKALVGGQGGLDRMEELVRAEIVTARPTSKLYGESELAFRHALVREAAYAMLTEEDRALGHRLAADWLERAGETDAMTLAEHHERGGDGLGAASWYRRAAVDAAEGNDYAAALTRADRGIACGPSEEVHALLDLSRAEAHRHRGENALAYARAQAAMQRLPPNRPPWYSAAREAVESAGNLGRLDAVRELAHALNPRNIHGPMFTEGLVAAASVAAELVVVDVEETARLLQAVALVGSDDLMVRAHVHHAHSARAYVAGELVEYVDSVTSAMDAFHRIGDVQGYLRAMVNLSVGRGMLGEWEEAESCCRDALARADRAGLGFVSALARHNLGLPLIRLGRLEEALGELRASVSAFRAQQHRRMLLGTHEHIALALAAQGDLAQAELEAQAAVDLAVMPGLATRPLAVLARIRLERGDVKGGLEAAEEALGTLVADERGIYSAVVLLAHSVALAASGDADRARAAALVGKERLLARASKITHAQRRESFLTRVPEHAELLQRASS